MGVSLCTGMLLHAVLNRRGLQLVICVLIFTMSVIFLLQLTQHQHEFMTVKITNRSVGRSILLPSSAVENVQRFLLLVGQSGIGLSVVAGMLDSHPNIVIASEYDLLSKFVMYPQIHSDKQWLFSSLLENSRLSSLQGLRNEHSSKKKKHALNVPRGWQGQYSKQISVIGDNNHGLIAERYPRNHSLFEHTYQKLQKTLGIPIYVFYIIGNPLDSIATMLLKNIQWRQSINITRKYRNEFVKKGVLNYFKQVHRVLDIIKNTSLDIIEIHIEDLIYEPNNSMQIICSHLNVECSQAYLTLCENLIYTSKFRSRDLIHWSDDNIKLVQYRSQEFNFLKGYIIKK